MRLLNRKKMSYILSVMLVFLSWNTIAIGMDGDDISHFFNDIFLGENGQSNNANLDSNTLDDLMASMLNNTADMQHPGQQFVEPQNQTTKYKCDLDCDKEFDDKYRLMMHKLNLHRRPKGRYLKPLDGGARKALAEELRKHKKFFLRPNKLPDTHKIINGAFCLICKKFYHKLSLMRSHYIKEHNQKSPKFLLCSQKGCYQFFNNRETLEEHKDQAGHLQQDNQEDNSVPLQLPDMQIHSGNTVPGVVPMPMPALPTNFVSSSSFQIGNQDVLAQLLMKEFTSDTLQKINNQSSLGGELSLPKVNKINDKPHKNTRQDFVTNTAQSASKVNHLFKCPSCPERFADILQFRKHARSCKYSKPVDSDVVRDNCIKRKQPGLRILKPKKSLYTHIKLNQKFVGSAPRPIVSSGQSAMPGLDLYHVNSQQAPSFKCPNCPARFRDENKLAQHRTTCFTLTPTSQQAIKHSLCGQGQYICDLPECFQRFDEDVLLKMHKFNFHRATHGGKKKSDPDVLAQEARHSLAKDLIEESPNSFSKGLIQVARDNYKKILRGFFCLKCKKYFKQKNALIKHKLDCYQVNKDLKTNASKYINNSLVCCNTVFKDKLALTFHKMKHHGGRFACDICGQLYKTSKGPLDHHCVGLCDYQGCTERFTDELKYKFHKVEKHGERFGCDKCHQLYTTSKGPLDHICKPEHLENPPKEFKTIRVPSTDARLVFQQELQAKRAQLDQVGNCPICSVACSNGVQFLKHIITEHKEDASKKKLIKVAGYLRELYSVDCNCSPEYIASDLFYCDIEGCRLSWTSRQRIQLHKQKSHQQGTIIAVNSVSEQSDPIVIGDEQEQEVPTNASSELTNVSDVSTNRVFLRETKGQLASISEPSVNNNQLFADEELSSSSDEELVSGLESDTSILNLNQLDKNANSNQNFVENVPRPNRATCFPLPHVSQPTIRHEKDSTQKKSKESVLDKNPQSSSYNIDNVTYTNLNALKQDNGWECGYYALYHLVTKYYPNTKSNMGTTDRQLYNKFIKYILPRVADGRLKEKYDKQQWLDTEDISECLSVFLDEQAYAVVISKTDLDTMPLGNRTYASIAAFKKGEPVFIIMNSSNNHWFVVHLKDKHNVLIMDSLCSAQSNRKLYLKKLIDLYTEKFPKNRNDVSNIEKYLNDTLVSLIQDEESEQVRKTLIESSRHKLCEFIKESNISITAAHQKYLFDKVLNNVLRVKSDPIYV